jgi:hypothetical protein
VKINADVSENIWVSPDPCRWPQSVYRRLSVHKMYVGVQAVPRSLRQISQTLFTYLRIYVNVSNNMSMSRTACTYLKKCVGATRSMCVPQSLFRSLKICVCTSDILYITHKNVRCRSLNVEVSMNIYRFLCASATSPSNGM